MWRLTDTSAMPYGKYKGRPMSGVPADYLLWLHENGKCSESVARYIEEHKPAIEQRRDTEAADRKQKTADRMPFGSYKGEVIAKVPAEYLLAMYESGKCPANVQEYVEQNMAELHLRAERDGRCRNALKINVFINFFLDYEKKATKTWRTTSGDGRTRLMYPFRSCAARPAYRDSGMRI